MGQTDPVRPVGRNAVAPTHLGLHPWVILTQPSLKRKSLGNSARSHPNMFTWGHPLFHPPAEATVPSRAGNHPAFPYRHHLEGLRLSPTPRTSLVWLPHHFLIQGDSGIPSFHVNADKEAVGEYRTLEGADCSTASVSPGITSPVQSPVVSACSSSSANSSALSARLAGTYCVLQAGRTLAETPAELVKRSDCGPSPSTAVSSLRLSSGLGRGDPDHG